jgi:hypothetical protein
VGLRRLESEGSLARDSEPPAVECSGGRSDDAEGAAEVVPADASGRPIGARPMAKASFAAGMRGLPSGEGTLRQDELLPLHVVVALVL